MWGHALAALAARVHAAAAQGIVATGKEAGRDASDPLDAEVAEVLCVARIVVGREMPEMVTEYVLQGGDAPLGIGRPR